jgi:hypothetical protein
MSFSMASIFLSCSGVSPPHTFMSEAMGPIFRPNGLNSAFQVPATNWSMAYSTW